jgi:hypothetical protein
VLYELARFISVPCDDHFSKFIIISIGRAAEPKRDAAHSFFNPRESVLFRSKVLTLAHNGFPKWECSDIHRNSAFLTGFSFVLSASDVDTHAAYENEISASPPTCVSCRPSQLSPAIAAPSGKSQR